MFAIRGFKLVFKKLRWLFRSVCFNYHNVWPPNLTGKILSYTPAANSAVGKPFQCHNNFSFFDKFCTHHTLACVTTCLIRVTVVVVIRSLNRFSVLLSLKFVWYFFSHTRVSGRRLIVRRNVMMHNACRFGGLSTSTINSIMCMRRLHNIFYNEVDHEVFSEILNSCSLMVFVSILSGRWFFLFKELKGLVFS